MEEHQATVDGVTRPLPENFFVIATQNPIEYEGTFPLPEAQTDRFLFKIRIGYPTPADELTLLQQKPFSRPDRGSGPEPPHGRGPRRHPHRDRGGHRRALDLRLHASPSHGLPPESFGGPGRQPPRGRGWIRAARVLAVMRERNFVTPDDIKELALPVLRHRLVRQAETEIEGVTIEQVIDQLLASVEVPR